MITNLWEREIDSINTIIMMESRGVRIDQEMCRHELAVGEARMNSIRREIGYNLASRKDLEQLFLVDLQLPVIKSPKTGRPTFDKKAMETYDLYLENRNSDLAQKVLEFRGYQKANGYYKSYLDLVSPDGRLRPHYWMHGTKTRRLSCREPNLQQVPRSSSKPWNGNMKSVFLPTDSTYRLLNADYSQLEFRLAAAYSREQILLDAFNDPTRNVFREMATLLELGYTQVKTATYAILYGAQVAKVASILGFDPERAQKFSDDWYGNYPKLMATAKKVNETAASRGYIKYWTGRRRHFPDKREARKAFNSLLQGGGAELVFSGMNRVKKRVDKDNYYHMLLQVHDSITGDAKKEYMEEISQLVVEEMCKVEEDKDFGVTFRAAVDFWGPKEDEPLAA